MELESLKNLQKIFWEDGKIVTVFEGPYRHRVVVHCSATGRQKSQFANGERAYFAHVELIAANGQWINQGAAMVPVLPDGRLLMVVEQRSPQGRFLDRPMMAMIGGRRMNLNDFGLCSSLEFPGGAVDPNEGLKAAFLRELQEETGVGGRAVYYRHVKPIYPFGSDIALRMYLGVVYLYGYTYAKHVSTDGGLSVFALTHEEVEENLWNGVIHSGQAGVLPWHFYKEVRAIRRAQPPLELELIQRGYLTVEEVIIAK